MSVLADEVPGTLRNEAGGGCQFRLRGIIKRCGRPTR
jgi:hypothetical protein